MKTRKAFEIEIQRYNVTPAQFLAYLRSMQKKHQEMAGDFNLDTFTAEGWSFNYSNALPSEKPCQAERGTDKPYQKQTYIRNHDGSTYNEIIEFEFDDEKTGHGYYYTVQIDVDEADSAENTAENIADIIRRRTEQAARQEAKAEQIETEADEAERKGYTAQWWIDSKRAEAASLRREAAATREAIAATQAAQEPQKAPQTAPAAEAEQQPTETENAPQAAPQAAEEATTDEQKEEDHTMSNTTERYDYMEHMTADVIDAIRERYTPDEIREHLDNDRDDFAQELNDDLWTDDSVTGNASGSYYCNAWRAEDAIAHNWDLIADMIDEFDAADVLRKGPEAIDVSIRCYLLGQAIDAALDQLDDEIPEAEEPDEGDDTNDTNDADSIPA